MTDAEEPKIQLVPASAGQLFRVTDTYEICELDMRSSFDGGPCIYVMTSAGLRLARLIKREVE